MLALLPVAAAKSLPPMDPPTAPQSDGDDWAEHSKTSKSSKDSAPKGKGDDSALSRRENDRGASLGDDEARGRSPSARTDPGPDSERPRDDDRKDKPEAERRDSPPPPEVATPPGPADPRTPPPEDPPVSHPAHPILAPGPSDAIPPAQGPSEPNEPVDPSHPPAPSNPQTRPAELGPPEPAPRTLPETPSSLPAPESGADADASNSNGDPPPPGAPPLMPHPNPDAQAITMPSAPGPLSRLTLGLVTVGALALGALGGFTLRLPRWPRRQSQPPAPAGPTLEQLVDRVQAAPLDGEAHFQLAVELMRRGEPKLALRHFERSFRLVPDTILRLLENPEFRPLLQDEDVRRILRRFHRDQQRKIWAGYA